MRRLLLAAFVAATLVVTGFALGASTSPASLHAGDPESAGVQLAGYSALPGSGETDPNGFGSFWKKLRKALQKIRDFINAVLDHTNEGSGSQGGVNTGGRFALLPGGGSGSLEVSCPGLAPRALA